MRHIIAATTTTITTTTTTTTSAATTTTTTTTTPLPTQGLALPPELLQAPDRPRYNDSLRFFGRGPCANYPRVTHYYDYSAIEKGWVDLYNASCLNGWVRVPVGDDVGIGLGRVSP